MIIILILVITITVIIINDIITAIFDSITVIYKLEENAENPNDKSETIRNDISISIKHDRENARCDIHN